MTKFLLSFLISSSALAATKGYDLKINLSMNGRHVSSPRLTVKPGEVALITQKSGEDESFLEVVATEEAGSGTKKGILMSFAVGYIRKNGERTIVSRPRIMAVENEKAMIMVGGNEGEESISLSVIAKRRAL
jgi:type II secretory pathway component GspD/PulD (secretin)